jgi:hypothetical protein
LPGSREIHLEVVAGVFLSVKIDSTAEICEFRSQMLAQAIERGLVATGRFQFHQLAKRCHHLITEGNQVIQQLGGV